MSLFRIGFFLSALFALQACSSRVSNPPLEQKAEKKVLELPKLLTKFPETHRALGNQFAIASQGALTSRAAEFILRSGGNIVDAAVAASFAVSVERPQSTGIGGGGFLLFHEAETKKTYAYDFREVAPLRSFADMYLKANGELDAKLSKEGVLAAGVPGLVAGLFEIHKKHGKLPWAQLLGPSIRMADEGFRVYPELAEALQQKADLLRKSPAALPIFFKDGEALQEGELLVQKDLARVLKTIQSKGREGFYRGWVGAAILDEFSSRGGLVTRADFEAYEVKERDVLRSSFGSVEILSMPPPSSGGAHIIQMLKALSRLPLDATNPGSPENILWTSSVMQQAFADRAEYMGDSDFVSVPLEELMGDRHAQNTATRILKEAYRDSDSVFPGDFDSVESTETTHFSLMDAAGNAVASTQTINGWFGSGVVVPSTGIVLNNEMDDFTAQVGASNMYGAIGGEPNKIQPQKRPLSSMSPTIVIDPISKEALLALGSPSGTRIINCVLHSLMQVYFYGFSLEEAQSSLRYHHQWRPDVLMVEAPGFELEVVEALEEAGLQVEERDLGCRVQAVQNLDEGLKAVSDPRGQGQALAR